MFCSIRAAFSRNSIHQLGQHPKVATPSLSAKHSQLSTPFATPNLTLPSRTASETPSIVINDNYSLGSSIENSPILPRSQSSSKHNLHKHVLLSQSIKRNTSAKSLTAMSTQVCVSSCLLFALKNALKHHIFAPLIFCGVALPIAINEPDPLLERQLRIYIIINTKETIHNILWKLLFRRIQLDKNVKMNNTIDNIFLYKDSSQLISNISCQIV